MTHTINVENVSTLPQRGWTTFGLPDDLAVKGECVGILDGREFPLVIDGNEAHMLCTLKGSERATVKVDLTPRPAPPHVIAPWVGDQPERLVPRFRCNGHDSLPMGFLGKEGPVGIWVDRQNSAVWRFHFRTRIAPLDLNIEGWISLYSNQEVVPFNILLSYGTTAPGWPRDAVLPSVSMFTGEKPVIDHRMPKGLHEPMWRTDIVPGQLHWESELATPKAWLRCRKIRVKGAVLCLPPEDKFGQLPGNPLVANLQAREQAGIYAIANVWDEKERWGPFGRIPKMATGLSFAENSRRRTAWLRREGTTGNELAARPYAQPPSSGQTGEQPDFGASRCEHALAENEPWALHDLEHSVDAWHLRPYGHRNPDGTPVSASQHTAAMFYNLRPEERFGDDMMGWPEPVGWIGDWDTSDNQHRSDNLLYGMWMLTRDPTLDRTIRDMLMCQELELYQGTPPLGSGLSAPRSMRVLSSLCYAYHCGYRFVETTIRRMVKDAYTAASFRAAPNGADIKVLSLNESKYGWKTPTGQEIRAWLTWQEGIADMAFYAAWKLLNIPEALELALTSAATIANHGFFQQNGQWFCCYAVALNETDRFKALPDSDYNLTQPNYKVFVFGIQRWSIAALTILTRHMPNTPAGQRARQIIDFFGAPREYSDACWWAV